MTHDCSNTRRQYRILAFVPVPVLGPPTRWWVPNQYSMSIPNFVFQSVPLACVDPSQSMEPARILHDLFHSFIHAYRHIHIDPSVHWFGCVHQVSSETQQMQNKKSPRRWVSDSNTTRLTRQPNGRWLYQAPPESTNLRTGPFFSQSMSSM